ncbi:MAG: hypothetical protein ACLSVD_16235 [Eggerthellaceae bacterium]
MGTMELGNTPRPVREDQIPLIQNFVRYLIDEIAMAERYGSKVPTAEEALIAERKGGAYKPSRSWPALKTSFDSNEKQFPPSASAAALLEPMGNSAAIWDSINGIDTPCRSTAACACQAFMNSPACWAWEALTRLDFWLTSTCGPARTTAAPTS